MNEFDNMLVDVRNSFRFLYSFNRRLLDLMMYISKRFNIPYVGGYPKFSDTSPKEGKGDLDCWGWDWLNLYLYEFHFANEKIQFSIIFQADTGQWDSEVDSLDVENFEKPSEAKSRLIFVFSNNEFWDMDQPLEDKYLKKDFEQEYTIYENKKPKEFCKIFNLNKFSNRNNTDKSLKEFIKYLQLNKVNDLSIVEEV